MRTEFVLLFLAVGIGNYLMRYLPLLWALRGAETEPEEPRDAASTKLSGLLPFVGLSVVGALLVTSVLPEVENLAGVIRTVTALLPTLAVAMRFGNLGLTVLVGVSAFWLVSLLV